MLLVTSRRSKISRSFAKVKLGFVHLLDCLSIPNEQVNILSSIETFGAVIRVDQVFDDFLYFPLSVSIIEGRQYPTWNFFDSECLVPSICIYAEE